jgi:hypothetical protein
MTRFSLSNGRYSAPYNSRYARYINERTIVGIDVHVNNENKKNQEIKHGSYGGLLFHPKWKAKRAEILTRDNNRCIICTNSNKLEVHHRQYHMIKETGHFKPPWDYPDNLLITLCVRCHQRGHAKYKVPTIQV